MVSESNQITEERDKALSRLEHLSDRLRSISMQIMLMTLVNIALTLAAVSGIFRYFKSETLYVAVIAVPVVCAILAIVSALQFDFYRKEGDAYFEELSDELHGSKISNNKETYVREEFSLRARIIMRNYSNCASLPLIPGRYGPGIMAGVNLMLAFQAAIFGARFY